MAPTDSIAPHPALRRHVERYVQLELDVPAGACLRQRVSALRTPVAVVHWSGNVAIPGAPPEHQISARCVSGPLTRWYDNLLSGSLRTFFVHFTPTGARALLRLRGEGLADRAVPLDDLLTPELALEARAWAAAVVHAPGLAARAEATDRFLLRRLEHAPGGLDPVDAAVELLERHAGLLRVSELAAELGHGERTLRRRFREAIGVSVKTFARITRFEHAHAFLQATPGTGWKEAVARFGYADQSHLLLDYRELAGTSPTRFAVSERQLEIAMTFPEPPPV